MPGDDTQDGDSTPSGRPYGGQDTEARRAGRRDRLMQAAYEIFGGREGWGQATVERLCTTAGVATRSIYEEFGSREGLLLAMYGALLRLAHAEVEDALAAAAPGIEPRVSAAVRAYITFMTEDPRRAQIVHLSMRYAGEWAEESRAAAIKAFAAQVSAELPDAPVSQDTLILRGYALTGAVNEVLTFWARTASTLTADQLCAELVPGFVAVLSRLDR